MESLSRLELYRNLIDDEAVNDNQRRLLMFNIMLLSNVETFFLTNDESNYSNEINKNELLSIIENNINNIRNNEEIYKIDSVRKTLFALKKESDKINFTKGNRFTPSHVFNKVINELSAFNTIELSREELPEYMKVNNGMPQVFLSHAYDDKLYTYSLFNYFYRNNIYLYVDWMHRDKKNDGRELKKDLQMELKASSQLLFMRTLNSELNIQGKQMIRAWCSWELGNFYHSVNPYEKYLINLYSIDKYENIQYHGMKIYSGLNGNRLCGLEIK